jgi:hypothetical protein
MVLVRNNEFDRRSSSDLHISGVWLWVLTDGESDCYNIVGWLRGVGFLSGLLACVSDQSKPYAP